VTTLPWRERVGTQRDWMWRGWQTRYTCIRAKHLAADSTPLILLHGFGASIANWRNNLTELGDHHTVYALDMLGFGASEKVSAAFGIELWVEQVYEFWQTFVRRPVVLVGNSLGSSVCLAVAAAHPDMVKGIVMLNLPDSSVLETPRVVKGAIAVSSPILRPVLGIVLGIAKGIFTSPLVFNPLFWLIRQPWLVRFWARQAYALPASITDEVVEIFSLPARDRNAARALRTMINTKAKPQTDYRAKTILPNLQIPMLLFWGLQDKMVPPMLARLFPAYNANMQLIEIPNAGHCPHDECPDLVNREILDWIEAKIAP
jgi:pimeloyl-ACP methyl ester carboxylesterase